MIVIREHLSPHLRFAFYTNEISPPSMDIYFKPLHEPSTYFAFTSLATINRLKPIRVELY